MSRTGTNPFRCQGSPYWYCWYQDASGRERRVSTKCAHLSNARKFLAERRAEVERAKVGLIDRFAESRRRPLDELVQDYRLHLVANDRAPRYVAGTVRILRAAIASAQATTLDMLTAAAVSPFLAKVRSSRSAKTHREHVATLKAFGGWLVANTLWPENPFAALGLGKVRDGDRKFRRFGLSREQVDKLAEAATVRGLQEYARTHGGRESPQHAKIVAIGKDRALIYWFAATTGMRKSEMAALTWRDLHLEGDAPFLELFGANTKNRQDARVPLQRFVAAALKARRHERGVAAGKPIEQTAKVFSMPDKLAEHVRRDAAFAGIVQQHRVEFRRLDFHALRYSCVAILRELGVRPEIVQRVMRHADIRLTLQLYGAVGDEAVTAAMRDVVPAPAMFAAVDSLADSLGRTTAPKRETTRSKRRGNGPAATPTGTGD
jgi:integrase